MACIAEEILVEHSEIHPVLIIAGKYGRDFPLGLICAYHRCLTSSLFCCFLHIIPGSLKCISGLYSYTDVV